MLACFIFRLETKQDQQKYGEIISDFSYFKMSDEFDCKVDSNPVSTGFLIIQMFEWSCKFNPLAHNVWCTHHMPLKMATSGIDVGHLMAFHIQLLFNFCSPTYHSGHLIPPPKG
jgi:hypothetical protein